MGEEMQTYNVFYTDKPLSAGTEPDFTLMLPLKFASEEEALIKSFKLIFSGAVVWKIEGSEGFHLDRAEIEARYWKFKTT